MGTCGPAESEEGTLAIRDARVKARRPGHWVDGAVGDADGGTLVLDEVIGLSPALQRRLLDLVKRGRYHREFEDRERVAQVNVIVITDGNLMGEVTAGRFRHELETQRLEPKEDIRVEQWARMNE